jgi:cell division protein FtsB
VKALALGTFVIAAIAVSAMLDPDSGLEIWRELRRDLAVSDVRVERLIRENDALRGEIATLESEPDALDRAIREELDLALPGEIVVRFEPTPAPQPLDALEVGQTGDDGNSL